MAEQCEIQKSMKIDVEVAGRRITFERYFDKPEVMAVHGSNFYFDVDNEEMKKVALAILDLSKEEI